MSSPWLCIFWTSHKRNHTPCVLSGPAYFTQHCAFKSIHADVYISSSRRYTVAEHPIVRKTLQFIIHFTAQGHGVYSQFWGIRNNAAINILVCVFALSMFAFLCRIYWWCNCWAIDIFNFGRYCHFLQQLLKLPHTLNSAWYGHFC